MAFTKGRIIFVAAGIFFISCALFCRLTYLQIVQGRTLAMEAISSRIQEVALTVSRGEILDCFYRPLTNATKMYSIVVFPRQAKKTLPEWHTYKNIANLRDCWIKVKESDKPFKVPGYISKEQGEYLSHLAIPGVVVVEETLRYNTDSLAAHIVGYINMADNEGMAGVEKKCNSILKGENAMYIAAFVDAGNQIIPGLGYKMLETGSTAQRLNAVLTINSRVQSIVEGVMDNKVTKGAVLIMNPYTGEIIAMASRPNFNGNDLVRFLSSPNAPLVNRAIASFQPGSIFKLAVACAALEYGVVKPQQRFFDRGYINVNNLRFEGWDYKQGGRGDITFEEALAYSSNPVFIQIGLSIGAPKLLHYAEVLGLGKKTALDFPSESGGNLPDPRTVYPGDLANISIGQGTVEVTPLQVAQMLSSIVNDGIQVEPTLVKGFIDANYNVVKTLSLPKSRRVMRTETAAQLRKMMMAVTKYGTGREAYVDGIGCAGKTGTAETGHKDKYGKNVNHAWFAGYGPAQNPRYVAIVLIEEGMSGSQAAAPVFAEIMRKILLPD